MMAVSPQMRSSFLIGLVAFLSLYLVVMFLTVSKTSSYIEGLEKELPFSVAAIKMPVPEFPQVSAVEVLDDFVPQNGVSLLKAPVLELLEDTDAGDLPKVSDRGLSPFEAYRRPFTLADHKGPFIAIGVTGYGLSDRLSKAQVKLPPEVSLLASPYAHGPEDWVHLARQFGHEVWLNIPFETKDYPETDTGQYTILKRSSLRLNADRLSEVMASSVGYAGLYSEMDDTLKQAHVMLKGLFHEIYERGLAYLELGIPPMLVETLAAERRAPFLQASILIDGETASYRDSLRATAQHAKEHGSAMAVITPTPAMIKYLPEWLEELQRDGITLVPISAFQQL